MKDIIKIKQLLLDLFDFFYNLKLCFNIINGISFNQLNILLIIKYTVQELRMVYVLLGRNSDFNNVELVRNMIMSIFYLQERRDK